MALSNRAQHTRASIAAMSAFFTEMSNADRPDVVDLTFGNPHEMALPGLVDAIRAQVEPQTVDWFAYQNSRPEAQEAVASGLRAELGLDFEPADIAMTQGAFGAIELAFAALTDAGDEVVIPLPGWFCYAPMLRATDLVPVDAPLDPETFDLDVEAIARAITPRTRIVVVNSPANPTGRVYPKETWDALAEVLDRASAAHGRRIWLLSDEPYRRIRFDGIGFASPAGSYPWTLIDYSYGKILLAPGQRLGYLAISPLVPDDERAELRGAMDSLQLAIGWGWPDSIMQRAVPELEHVSIDMAELTRRRDRAYGALTDAGYAITRPEGTFYLWGRAPGGDGNAFFDRLAERGVYVFPGALFDQPRHFRISLTATTDMLERAIPHLVELAQPEG
ncbi:aminotransferase class I/II-fold pyridoxal phosphate-dependent enzyme [Agromyces mangrovi Wang et al. 2018]|uniref:aminotransferase class I/II-fold pyridoxal phosphate-dependent enzyme n=1 Tax=Agromyces mangrovi TaxID=1858653 RepID=UPI00257297D5|nr:aminotransferase class I/II-fold pyridoxal phosphate-dependent enzyme [Agromyces mangrovi]BDZ64584.1 aminotransferase [Agromyces mangrovi]